MEKITDVSQVKDWSSYLLYLDNGMLAHVLERVNDNTNYVNLDVYNGMLIEVFPKTQIKRQIENFLKEGYIIISDYCPITVARKSQNKLPSNLKGCSCRAPSKKPVKKPITRKPAARKPARK